MADEGLLARLLLQEAEQKEVAAQAAGRYERIAQTVLDQLMPMQRELALDDHKRIGLLTPGRNGKTWTVRGRLFRSALKRRGSYNLYIGLTRAKAEQEIWDGDSGLLKLCERLQLKEPEVTFNRAKLTVTIEPLGSKIVCGGADDMKAIEAYRGGPGYNEVWIDEAKSHDPELLSTLIEDILEPRVNARNGVLGMCGTPGNILAGLFYDITRTGSERSIPFGEPNPAEDLRWAMHRWSLAQNTTIIEGTTETIWERALRLKRSKGWTDQNPTWMREYLGLWAADDTDFVYRFRPYTDDGAEFNVWTPKPATRDNPFGLPRVVKLAGGDQPIRWLFAIALDLGEKDPAALGVFAFAENVRQIFHVHEFYRPTKSIDVIAAALDHAVKLTQAYSDYPVALVGDTAALGGYVLEEVYQKVGHRVVPAKKADKLGFIELVNGDLVDARLKVLKGSQLAKQMAELQWDEQGKRENKSQRNDCCDYTLYARGAMIKYLSRHEPVAETPKNPEEAALDAVFERMRARAGDFTGATDYEPGEAYQPD